MHTETRFIYGLWSNCHAPHRCIMWWCWACWYRACTRAMTCFIRLLGVSLLNAFCMHCTNTATRKQAHNAKCHRFYFWFFCLCSGENALANTEKLKIISARLLQAHTLEGEISAKYVLRLCDLGCNYCICGCARVYVFFACVVWEYVCICMIILSPSLLRHCLRLKVRACVTVCVLAHMHIYNENGLYFTHHLSSNH